MTSTNPVDPQDNMNQPNQSSSSGASSGTSNVSSSQPGQGPYSPTQTGSGFTNIQRIIGANSQNQLGQAVGGGVTNTANQTGQNINNAQNQFQQDTNTNNLDTQANRNYITNTYSNIQNQAIPSQPSSGSSALDQSNAAANMYTATGANTSTPSTTSSGSTANAYSYPTGTYNPTQDQSKFNQFTSGQYVGPQNLNNLTNLQTQSADVNNLQNSLNSQEGRQGLLQRFVGGNQQYGQGEQNLDALLLGQTGAPQLAQARLATQALPDLNNLSQADQATAQTMQNRAQDLANFTKTGANTTAANINDYLTNQANTINAATTAQLTGLQSDLNKGTLSQSDISLLQTIGIDPTKQIYGGTPSQAITGILNSIQNNQVNSSNVANQNQYAAQQALQALSGENAGSLGNAATSATPTTGATAADYLNIDPTQIGAVTGGLTANTTGLANWNNLQNTQSTAFNNALANNAQTKGLSQSEIDYLNSQPVISQLQALGGQLNAGNNIDTSANALAQQMQQYDKSQGQTGLNQYDTSTPLNSTWAPTTFLNNLGDYGGTRTYDQGEGASAFIQNLQEKQAAEQALQKQYGQFSNLSSLLAAQQANSGNTAS